MYYLVIKELNIDYMLIFGYRVFVVKNEIFNYCFSFRCE